MSNSKEKNGSHKSPSRKGHSVNDEKGRSSSDDNTQHNQADGDQDLGVLSRTILGDANTKSFTVNEGNDRYETRDPYNDTRSERGSSGRHPEFNPMDRWDDEAQFQREPYRRFNDPYNNRDTYGYKRSSHARQFNHEDRFTYDDENSREYTRMGGTHFDRYYGGQPQGRFDGYNDREGSAYTGNERSYNERTYGRGYHDGRVEDDYYSNDRYDRSNDRDYREAQNYNRSTYRMGERFPQGRWDSRSYPGDTRNDYGSSHYENRSDRNERSQDGRGYSRGRDFHHDNHRGTGRSERPYSQDDRGRYQDDRGRYQDNRGRFQDDKFRRPTGQFGSPERGYHQRDQDQMDWYNSQNMDRDDSGYRGNDW